MKLAKNRTAIQNPTDSEKSNVMELQTKVHKVSKDIAGITNKHTSDEVKQMYSDIADFNSQLDAFKKLVKFNKAQCSRVHSSIKLANNVHGYYMKNKNFVMVAEFQQIVTVGKSIIENSSKDNDEVTIIEKGVGTSERVDNSDESSSIKVSCTILNTKGVEEDIDDMFVEAGAHNDGNKRKQKTSNAHASKKYVLKNVRIKGLSWQD